MDQMPENKIVDRFEKNLSLFESAVIRLNPR